MRQLTTLPDEAAARRLAAFLVTQKIEAHAEQEKDGWAVWVREEDRLPAAKEHLSKYRLEPDHPRYRGAEQQAQMLVREEQEKRERAQRNVHDVSRQWGKGGIAAPKSCPLVIAMILASVLVGVLTNVGTTKDPELIAAIQFSDGRLALKDPRPLPLEQRFTSIWKNIRRGEIWRLVTPIFLHFGMMHLIFNMMWLYDFGGQIENNLKSLKFLALVVFGAAFSNICQVLVSSLFEEPLYHLVGNFGGMSGVNYALFGFLYIRTQIFQDRYVLHPSTIVLMTVWLFACMVWNQLPRSIVGENAAHVANAAHVGGLLAGMALAYLPFFKK
jgi:GlpG protein